MRKRTPRVKGIHPLADLIPERANEDDLYTQIAERGPQEPIYVFQKQVIEGRVRERVCKRLDIQPQYKDWVLLGLDGDPLAWMVNRHVESHELTELELIQLVARVLPEFRAMPGQTERLLYESLGRRLSWNKLRALRWLDEAGALEPVLTGEQDVFEAARKIGLAPDKRHVALGTSYGAGDKFDEATQPLKRYLAAWKRKGYEFRHLNPKEAARRLSLIESLIEELQATIPDLKKRSVEATLTVPSERKR